MEKIKTLFKNININIPFTSEDDLSESEIELVIQYTEGKQILTASLSPSCLNIMGMYHQLIDIDYTEMKKYYLMAIETGFARSMNNYAYHCQYISKDYQQMEKHYLMAIQKGYVVSMNNYADYHNYISNDYAQMKKYYLMAIQNGCVTSMNNYACYHQNISKDYQQMHKYYLMAIQNGSVESMDNYANYHESISNDYAKMEKYYLMGIRNGNVVSMNNYAYYHHHTSKDYQQMQKYYLLAIKNGNVASMNNYAYYHQHITEDYQQMKKYYFMVLDAVHSPQKKRVLVDAICGLSQHYGQYPSLEGLKFSLKYNSSIFTEQLLNIPDLSDECWEFLSSIDPKLIESGILRNMVIRLQKKVDLLDVHFKYTNGLTIQEIKKDFFSKINTDLDDHS